MLVTLGLVGTLACRVREVPPVEMAAPVDAPVSPDGLLLAGGSLESGVGSGMIAADLGSQRELGNFVSGGPTQGDAFARTPDGHRAYILDRILLASGQRPEWQLVELDLPSLKVLRRAALADGINLLGRARIVAVAADGAEVYVETMRVVGPQRFDRELGVGQPESDYGIAVFDVARGVFTRTFRLDPPWCGVGELFTGATGQLAVLCTLSHQVRVLDPKAGKELGRLDVSGEMAERSPAGSLLWVFSRSGNLEELDLANLKVTRRTKLSGSEPCSLCVPLQRVHASADGKRLLVRAAPDKPDLPPTGRGDHVWIVDTDTLQRVGDLPLPAAAFDAAPTPDGAFVLASTLHTDPPTDNASWLIELATGHATKTWPWALCCLEIWPRTAPRDPQPEESSVFMRTAPNSRRGPVREPSNSVRAAG